MRFSGPSWACGGLAFSLFLGAGCSHVVPPVAPSFIQPRLPAPISVSNLNLGLDKPPLSVGDTFIYDNPPEKWTVASIDGPFVGWVSNSGAYAQTAWATILPPLRWGGAEKTRESGQRKLTQITGTLFPLKKGNKVSFYEESIMARPPETESGFWQCEVTDLVNIVVPAGKAQTWEIICQVGGRDRLVINYSEKIGHFVRQAWATGSGVLIRQLTGYARANASSVAAAPMPSSNPK